MTDAPHSPTACTSRACWGMLCRRQRWGLSWKGLIAVLLLLSLGGWALTRNLYSFFAVTARTDANVLVVEGWVHVYAVEAAADEFTNGRYDRVYSTGGPVQGNGGYTTVYSTSASIGAGRLRSAGIPADKVNMAPSRINARDRTYNSAIALKETLRAQNLRVAAINVLTEDVHARRTRLLFQKAFGDETIVGVIAVPNPDYDADHWWRYSQAVREVIGECISYAYARLFFFPRRPSTGANAHAANVSAHIPFEYANH
jgi:uncharacterized SAM-binding protein YcdF (DUF218 family)